MVVLQAFFEVLFDVDGVRVQPCDQGTMIFGVVASRRPFLEISHTNCCLMGNPVDAT